MIIKGIITVAVIVIYGLVYWLDIRTIKSKKIKDTLQLILGILFVPAFILLLDMWNCFEIWIPNIYHDMTEKYDMLSFLGAYLSAIVSSVLLIIITNSDREENTKIIQDAQRPYLDIRYPKLSNKFIEDKKDDSVIFFHRIDNMSELLTQEYVCLELINNGESVAIIDINNMQVEIQYNDMEKDENGVQIEIVKTLNPKINTGLPRLSLGKGKSIYIIFLYKPFYRGGKVNKASIIYSNIIYKDLFNKKYIDECRRNENGEQIVIQDNKEITEE